MGGLCETDYAQDEFHIPPTVRRIDAAWTLEEFTLPALLREAVHVLGVYGVVDRNADYRDSTEEALTFA